MTIRLFPHCIPAVFASARYVPVVKDLLEGLIDGKMDKAFLAYTRDAPAKGAISSASMQPVSARSKPGWASKKEDKKLKTPGVWISGWHL
jgi:hypothetical protein